MHQRGVARPSPTKFTLMSKLISPIPYKLEEHMYSAWSCNCCVVHHVLIARPCLPPSDHHLTSQTAKQTLGRHAVCHLRFLLHSVYQGVCFKVGTRTSFHQVCYSATKDEGEKKTGNVNARTKLKKFLSPSFPKTLAGPWQLGAGEPHRAFRRMYVNAWVCLELFLKARSF